jgi:hypothetical protein
MILKAGKVPFVTGTPKLTILNNHLNQERITKF